MITVFGSLNVDLVTHVNRLPAPGETVLGPSYETVPGGKGANQALAAARAGASVRMIGAIGRDGFGEVATRLLKEGGVDLTELDLVEAPTGAAFITLDDRGENCIVVASGANAAARAAPLQRMGFGAGEILLMQRETPPSENLAAARIAKAKGARVMLNAAPSSGFETSCLEQLDVLIANEGEAQDVARSLGWSEEDPAAIMLRLSMEYPLVAIATLGARGAVGYSTGAPQIFSPPPVSVLDTVGAGDAFCGAFAAVLDRGLDWRDAMRHGVAAGSLACTRRGAQPSLPLRAEIERMAAQITSSPQ